MTNLIKNGDFSEHDSNWQVSDPEKAIFPDESCRIARAGSVSQDVILGDDGGGAFLLSARMKTLPGFAGRVTLQPYPTGETVKFDLAGGQNWVTEFKAFTAQQSTLKFTVTLEAIDGPSGEFGAYFSGLTLKRS